MNVVSIAVVIGFFLKIIYGYNPMTAYASDAAFLRKALSRPLRFSAIVHSLRYSGAN
ncbi:hypothetical protein [Paenibacillus sp. J23TS9]|uniref:hypothetical protein n=1 Tax=Paenibacillus sp. J23TS9 TaxID=2807193 RepID=UPI001BCBD71B|nr:hypothetical protein [Paenibacillus sp. J23TS9]